MRAFLCEWMERIIIGITPPRSVPLIFDMECFMFVVYIYLRLVAGLPVGDGILVYGERSVEINERRDPNALGVDAYVLQDHTHQTALMIMWLMCCPSTLSDYAVK